MENSNKEIRVLIVEDDYLVSEMIKGSLQDVGYSIVGEAIDGFEAIELTCKLRPDVVLMDIEMPDKSGIEATQEIFRVCPTPVVVLTAYEKRELVVEATRAGVGAYLIKPPNARELERAITIAIARFEDTKNLRRLNLTLKARNEELDTFAHTISHNLQHSLDLSIGYANILKKQARLPEELEYYLNMIIRNSRTMTTVIDELQLLAGIRRTEITTGPLNTSRIVARAQQRLAYLIEETRTKLTIPNAWPTATGYEPWLVEVWVTLISSSIKFGGRPPRLHLGATTRSDGTVRFWVRNNGPGLTPDQMSQLFLPLDRLSQLKPGGGGLGLAVVRQIIEKLGGEVGVESEGIPGRGCNFSFILSASDEMTEA